ncbi:MAG: adenylate/guanylate cyclase domain-containing protein, partial [Acidobacteria bacterium]|nr:adenylate/guanylate cyclase domain-containing protein [Acidobacteriota bacterium]
MQEKPDQPNPSESPNPAQTHRLREYLSQPGAPNSRLYPRWLARKLNIDERDLLGALAYGVFDGLVEMHWEVHCPFCSLSPTEFESLKETHSRIECVACESDFDLHLDRDVRVTFSATERMRRERSGETIPMPPEGEQAPTRGLDLLLVPAFWELFSGDAPPADESLSIARVAILFTDLKGSTAMYAERGDPRAYRLVRDHFAILGEAIDRNNGALVKTIGDAVMASFASGADAVRAAFESQAELCARAQDISGELVLKAGVHAGACLPVKLNDRLDFFGGAVNTAARVQGLSRGNDVVVTDQVIANIETEGNGDKQQFRTEKSFDARLRGLPEPVRVHRLVAATANGVAVPGSNKSVAARF